ncbi:MAG: DUF3313 domain-containing protein [Desulfuromonadales bacterium]|nr:DUF3313 domain-containing protein [Desulfuromonadales bacterium]
MKTKALLVAIAALSCLFLVACAAQKIEVKTTSGFLADYSALAKGGEDQLGLVYEQPGLELSSYKKVMVDHVVLYLNPQSEAQAIQPEQMTKLAEHFHQALINSLQKQYQITDQAGSEVMRIRAAISDVEPGHPVAGTMSSIMPLGIVVSSATKATTDSNVGVGRAAMEIELVDSVTGERLAAAVDRREGGKQVGSGKWEDVEEAFEHWAEKLVSFLKSKS